MEFLRFWLACIWDGIKLSFETFGAIDGVCVIVTAILYWTKDHHQKLWEEKGEPFVKKYAVWIVLVQLGVCVVLVAPYTRYKDEKGAKEIAQFSFNEKAPKLDGFIDQTMIWNEPGTTNTIIVLQVSINNSGGAASIAEDFKLKLAFTNNTSVAASLIDFSDQYTWNALRANTVTVFKLKRSDLISEKTGEAIQPGCAPRGWLAFRFPGVTLNNISPKQFELILSFLDVSGKEIFVTNGMWKGKAATNSQSIEFPKTLPGSVNLVDTNIQLQTEIDTVNWQPPELENGCTNVVLVFGSQVFEFPLWQAEISPENNGAPIRMSDLPDSFTENLKSNPGFSPRSKYILAKHGAFQSGFGSRVIDYPFYPFVISNRLFLYIQIPFMSGLKKLVMNDGFDTAFPAMWDRNYGTNRYVYEVVNENKNPILQVGYIKPNMIQFNGIFIIDTNSVLEAFYDAPRLVTLSFKTVDIGTNQEFTNSYFSGLIAMPTQTNLLGAFYTNLLYGMQFSNQRPMFAYPSYKNIGSFSK